MRITYVKFSNDIEPVVELDEYDKFWLKQMFKNLKKLPEEIEINFYKEKDYYIPIFPNENKNPDYIGIFSREEIIDIIKNSKKRNKKFYFEILVER